MHKIRASLFVLAGAVAATVFLAEACSSSDTPDAGGTLVGTIDSHGGTATNDQGVIIFVPAGALGAGDSVSFTIDANTSAPTPAGTTVVGSAWLIGPTGKTFLKPITIAIPVDATKLGSHAIGDVAVYTSDITGSSYTPLVTSPYASGSRVSCGAEALGLFVPVLGPLADAGILASSSGSSESTGTTTTSTSTTTTTSTSTSTTTTTTTAGSSSSTTTAGSTGSTGTTSAASSSSSTTTASSSSSASSSASSAASSSSGTTTSTTTTAAGSSGSTGTTSTSTSTTTTGSSSGSTTGSACANSGESCGDTTACCAAFSCLMPDAGACQTGELDCTCG